MSPIPGNHAGTTPDHDDISRLFLEYNAIKYENLLRRFAPAMQKHLKALPMFFHVNQNLFPGHVNQHVPCGVSGYEPDADTLHHAGSFNSAFSYTADEETTPAIEAVYLQDNLKSGKLILWIIYNHELETEDVELLKQKAATLNAWREAKKIHLHCHVALPHTMAAAYWGEKYNAMYPDKSIFLDDFYSEAICLAGKPPVWWYIAPEHEARYEQQLEQLKTSHEAWPETCLDLGAMANPRPQDYLASMILNLLHVRNCPEETWLNILALCHKLSAWPQIDGTALRLKQKIHTSASGHNQYQDIYCATINETLERIYERAKTIIIDRTLKLVAHRHATDSQAVNIYRMLLVNRGNSFDAQPNSTLDYEYTTAMDIIHDLLKQAVTWFMHKLRAIDPNLLVAGSDTDVLIQHLLHRIEHKAGHFPLANLLPIKNTTPFDICLRHNIENRHNNWSLLIANNGFEIRQGKDPVELAAWGVFNRIISHTTRLSVQCPYMSVKQTRIADITAILLEYLPAIQTAGLSMQTLMLSAVPVKDILIFNEEKNGPDKPGTIQIFRFQLTSHDEIRFEKYSHLQGYLQLVCNALGTDLQSGNKPHPLFIHCISGGAGKIFSLEARHIYNKMCHFISGPNRRYTHFMDCTQGQHYVIARNHHKLTAHADIHADKPEEYLHGHDAVVMYFSKDVDNHALLNHLYRNTAPGCLQLFYEIQNDSARIYIIDEHGVLTQFSQPFHDRQHFINQWLMFLYNSRNHVKASAHQTSALPNIDIYELSHNAYGQLVKTRLNSSMLPMDDHYFDLKVSIQGDKGKQVILFKCEDREFSSAHYGAEIYTALRKYLADHFKSGAASPVYVSDVSIPLSQLHAGDMQTPCIRDYVRYKMNIEKRLNTMINKN